MRTLLRVDVEAGTVTSEDLPEELRLLGGRALTSAVVAREVDPLCDPLGPANKIVFAPGVLAGTTAPNSSRLSVGCKSPLTGGIKEANSGGQAAGAWGVWASPRSSCRAIPRARSGCCTCPRTAPAWTTAPPSGARPTTSAPPRCGRPTAPRWPPSRWARPGSTACATPPWPAPTRKVTPPATPAAAAWVRSWAPGVSRPSWWTTPAPSARPWQDAERFDKARKTLVDGLKAHPVTSQGLTNFGTAILVNIINEAGALPTHNFHYGRFDQAEAISGETLHQNCEDRGGKRSHGCMTGCVIHCSNVYNDKDGKYVSSGVEYETDLGAGRQLRQRRHRRHRADGPALRRPRAGHHRDGRHLRCGHGRRAAALG